MRGVIVGLFVGLIVVLAVGCGSSSNDAVGTTTVVVTETTADTTDTMSSETTSTDTTDTTVAGTTSTDTTAVDTTATTATGLSAGCQKVADFSVEFGKALAAAGVNGGETDLEKTAKVYEAAAEKVPEEIRPAFRTLAAAYVKYAAAIQGLDLKPGQVPDAATIAKLAKAGQALSNQDLSTANADITAWVTKNCTTTG